MASATRSSSGTLHPASASCPYSVQLGSKLMFIALFFGCVSNYVVNGTRYLSWPERHFCCKCCTEEEGCGMLKPTWIQDAGGSYLGVYSVDYTYVDSWIIHGNEDNYWYQNATDGVPIQLVQGVSYNASRHFVNGASCST
eukprot:gb/GECG01013546.1/.p1 GENE.gb/GECG01013546.1/~~gb/GECG01013546.1/.p1  ORF type:complete len:140 (+),score=7.77 gb/GECG01013546.1/:1-420(+)